MANTLVKAFVAIVLTTASAVLGEKAMEQLGQAMRG